MPEAGVVAEEGLIIDSVDEKELCLARALLVHQALETYSVSLVCETRVDLSLPESTLRKRARTELCKALDLVQGRNNDSLSVVGLGVVRQRTNSKAQA